MKIFISPKLVVYNYNVPLFSRSSLRGKYIKYYRIVKVDTIFSGLLGPKKRTH